MSVKDFQIHWFPCCNWCFLFLSGSSMTHWCRWEADQSYFIISLDHGVVWWWCDAAMATVRQRAWEMTLHFEDYCLLYWCWTLIYTCTFMHWHVFIYKTAPGLLSSYHWTYSTSVGRIFFFSGLIVSLCTTATKRHKEEIINGIIFRVLWLSGHF